MAVYSRSAVLFVGRSAPMVGEAVAAAAAAPATAAGGARRRRRVVSMPQPGDEGYDAELAQAFAEMGVDAAGPGAEGAAAEEGEEGEGEGEEAEAEAESEESMVAARRLEGVAAPALAKGGLRKRHTRA